HVGETPVGQLAFQVPQQVRGIFLDALAFGLQAPEAHADKDMMIRFFHENASPLLAPSLGPGSFWWGHALSLSGSLPPIPGPHITSSNLSSGASRSWRSSRASRIFSRRRNPPR